MPRFSDVVCSHGTCCGQAPLPGNGGKSSLNVYGGLRWEVVDVSVTRSSNFSHGLLEGKGARDDAPPNH